MDRLLIAVLDALAFLLTISLHSAACADGGKVQLSQTINGRRITLFTSPTPLMTGPVDISILVQDAATAQVIHDANISIICQHLDTDREIQKQANRADSTNKLLQSAKLDLSQPGRWDIHVDIDSAGRMTAPVNLSKPGVKSSWVTVAVSLPVAWIVLFLVREKIVANRRRGRYIN